MKVLVRHLILAAGAGSRMGKPKALARIDADTFLQAVLAAGRRAGLDHPVVVVAAAAERIIAAHAGAACVFLRNPAPADGPISSIRTALRDAQVAAADALLVHPVDHPLVRPETLKTLVARFAAGGADIVVPCHHGRGGHPTLFGSAVFGELLAVAAGDGARVVVRRDPGRVARVPLHDPGVRINLDTPDDLRRAEGS